jgi:hypothetical protein
MPANALTHCILQQEREPFTIAVTTLGFQRPRFQNGEGPLSSHLQPEPITFSLDLRCKITERIRDRITETADSGLDVRSDQRAYRIAVPEHLNSDGWRLNLPDYWHSDDLAVFLAVIIHLTGSISSAAGTLRSEHPVDVGIIGQLHQLSAVVA